MQIFTQLVADPERLAILIVIWFVPTLWAAIHVARNWSGWSAVWWSLLILLLPVLGAAITLSHLRSTRVESSLVDA